MTEEPSSGDNRSIQIGQDAIGNAIISGNGNVVIFQPGATAAPQEEPQPSDIGPNPYKGLLAFSEVDADRFFGREAQVERLWELFRNMHEAVPGDADALRLLPILGPSGSGKSSLARAGLLPELARRPLPGRREAHVAVVSPGAHPLESLASILARIITKDPAPIAKTREVAGELKLQNDAGQFDGLRRITDAIPETAATGLIVFVDQFEEIYSLCNDQQQREAFLENLLHAVADPAARISAIITLRSDFLGATQQHPVLNRVISSRGVIIPAMNEAELRAAIATPAERAGHPLDDSTVDLLINETEDRDGALPLLQFTLSRVWEGLAVGRSASETLHELGGVGGALAGEAQRIFESLSEADQTIARRVFLGLVQFGEGTRDTRRRARIDSLVARGDERRRVESVIARFASAGCRLITLAADAEGHDTAELTHEALLDNWEQLGQWIETGRDDLRFQRRVGDAARHWRDNDRADGLLWRPPDSDLLAAFYQRAGTEMTPLQIEFFETSQRAEDNRLAAIEQDQREKDALYKTAREAVDNMLTEVGRKSLSDVPQLEEVRRRLLQQASAFYEQFRTQRTEDVEVRLESARAHHRVGDICRMLGEVQAGRRAYETAVEQLGELQAEFPGEPEYARQLADSRTWLGELLRTTDPASAGEQYDAAQQLLDGLHKQFPDDARYRQELARTYYSRGILLSDNRQADDAESAYATAIDLLETTQATKDLARCYNNLGNLLQSVDRPADAKKAYQSAIRYLLPLVESARADSADRREDQLELATYHNNLANLLLAQNELDAAQKLNRRALQLFNALATAIPSIRNEMANSHNSRGVILGLAGEHEKALRHFYQARQLWQELVNEFPDVAVYKDRLGNAFCNLGWIKLLIDQQEEASQLILSAVGYHQAACDQSPENDEFRQHVRYDHEQLEKIKTGVSNDELTSSSDSFFRTSSVTSRK